MFKDVFRNAAAAIRVAVTEPGAALGTLLEGTTFDGFLGGESLRIRAAIANPLLPDDIGRRFEKVRASMHEQPSAQVEEELRSIAKLRMERMGPAEEEFRLALERVRKD